MNIRTCVYQELKMAHYVNDTYQLSQVKSRENSLRSESEFYKMGKILWCATLKWRILRKRDWFEPVRFAEWQIVANYYYFYNFISFFFFLTSKRLQTVIEGLNSNIAVMGLLIWHMACSKKDPKGKHICTKKINKIVHDKKKK